MQTEDYTDADELFTEDYAYFSSTSTGWLRHAAAYCEMITQRLELNETSFVIELASNDGYLLKNFVTVGIPCLGVEPTKSTAMAAQAIGVPTLQEFFGEDMAKNLASKGPKADLILGNNVYAHVPDINDFTRGVTSLLSDEGVVTFEFPHLLQLLQNNQFDTVYHEHFSYLSLTAVASIFKKSGLRVFDVEELPTHGGSLRVYGCLKDSGRISLPTVGTMLTKEAKQGLTATKVYEDFQPQAEKAKDDFLRFLLQAKAEGKSVAGYGAAAKGNTFMNYAGIRPDLIPVIYDAAPSKQGKFMPASHIPILAPSELPSNRPDYLVILPWNIAEEVVKQNQALAEQGTKFVVAIPELRIL